ncbi:MAG: 1,4-dihydroxy-2-naphthoate octaprenyltransferase [Veillonella sp.]|uniref:1,4-dihydroxy-2-naphthoate octaprenyltransferase n=1 Tax=Veillonella sp. TaxID=1926307 RepID=UPI0028FE13CD|nr:1,4-dihydroxy-2-naphthoate octaprenyltransferase [Veillonella sp.]MDU2252274.1 1,4-dihydroxy-2-naphthoate octaprenyltransferase [Veillonella parvula]MDU1674239.1 1,4-dihydroxy-2-naphthoate octaprenyltransferase [Veillonella sp.]MDU1681326.1 1,4-dihydroxy-2-naphthoate octaprenyltransferase [Veillonella sp.]MDU1743788.1 1,4-dihydroxy-2-naphthoate octaprenyltransferase [Veillonella sp.]MDU7787500.1 1,4-dihydroxy-2-naphthoate octaprenyltransferase [Veillonella sp.]
MIQELIPLTRPRTLAAALGPTILGAAFSYYAFGATQGTGLAIFHTVLIFLAVVTAQIVANLWNEYKDFKSGLDAGQKVGNAGSITRGAITPELIITMIKVLMFVPITIGIYLSATITWYYIPIGFLCILISFLYSGGPKPISRTPFGEISSGIAMGFAIVLITGYAWTRELSLALLIPAIPSTLLVGSIMLTNNIRDIRNDESHGRHTLPIVLGRERALSLMSISYIFNFIWIIAWIIIGHMTWFALLAFLSAPLAFKTIHTLSTNTDEFQLDKAMGTTAGAAMIYQLMWAIGLIMGKLF